MTPEQFAELITQGDAKTIAQVAAPWNESDRRKFWKSISKIVRELRVAANQSLYVNATFIAVDVLKNRLGEDLLRRMIACDIAVLAVGPLPQARKVVATWDSSSVERCVRVLLDRRPEWIDEWVESRLGVGFSSRRDWNLIRPLIRHGICRKPLSDAYISWMASAARGGPHDGDSRSLLQVLLGDPGTLGDVWRLFEVETRALWIPEDYQPTESSNSWPEVLAKMAEQGHIDRQRLLDASLKALSSGLKNETLTCFVRFHNFLKPTLDEMAARQQMFFDLLANPGSHIVMFALENIAEIERAGRLDGKAYLAAVSPVFHLRSKGQSKKALQIAARIVQNKPECLPHGVGIVLEAMAHPAAEVQERAIGLIESWRPRLHPDHAITIRERLEELSPSVRVRAGKVICELRPAVAEPAKNNADGIFGSKLAELAREADLLISPWRERAGVDQALESLRAGRMPEPLEFDLLEARVLTGVAPIEPIRSVDALIDAASHAFETGDSADEFERIMDGISRLGDQRPADFERRTAPFVKRLRDIHLAEGTGRSLVWGSLAESIYQLLMAWLCRESPPFTHKYAAVHVFFDGRVQELIQHVLAGRARPLLAAPTHQGGWIDPVIFVGRLTELLQRSDEPGTFDLIQALLRLAPDGREEAITAGRDLPGHVGRAVRWTLGGEEGPNGEDSSHTSLWLAAGRARYPTGTLDDLPFLKIGKNQPDAFLPARYVWKPRTKQLRYSWDFGSYPPVEMTIEPEAPSDVFSRAWPTVALHQRDERWPNVPAWYLFFLAIWQSGVIAQVWPLCLDPFLVGGIHALGARLDMPASTLSPNYCFLRPWLEPDRPWTELAALAVWLGMISKDPGSKTMALDLLIQAIADGRARPQQMSCVLLKMMPGGWVKLNRVADALAEVARLSCLHSWFVAEALQGFLAGMEVVPRDAHLILTLLHELLVDLGMVLAPATLHRLETLPETGKAAKVATASRKLEPNSHAVKLRQAGLQVLEARIARAKRWSTGRAFPPGVNH
jgi:hypothetical protein